MSADLLGQALIYGLFMGGLYALFSLGLSLSWGLLKLVNIGYFALAFLGAYITYELGHSLGLPAWVSVLCIVPSFFVFGVALHWLMTRFRIEGLTSLLVCFCLIVILESLIQLIWTADFRRHETALATASYRIGPFFLPVLHLLAGLAGVAACLGAWIWLRWTYLGKALRASAEDAPIAAAFGINHRRLSYLLAGLCAALSGITGVFIALTSTLAPTQIWLWFGVVFAVVIIGRVGNPIGVLMAGVLIGVIESMTMAVMNPAWSPLVAFSVLILILVWQPKWL